MFVVGPESELVDGPAFADDPSIGGIARSRRPRPAREDGIAFPLFEELVTGRIGTARGALVVHVQMARGVGDEELVGRARQPFDAGDFRFVD